MKVGLPRIRCGKMVDPLDPVVGFRIRRDCCGRDGTFFRMFWQISHRQTWCAAPSILPTEPVVWKKIFCADVHCAPCYSILSYQRSTQMCIAVVRSESVPGATNIEWPALSAVWPGRARGRDTDSVEKFTFFWFFLSFLLTEVEIGVGVRPACHLRPPAW